MQKFFTSPSGRYSVVDDGTPGLKIFDHVKQGVDLYNFGAFYDGMKGYHPDAVEAAKNAIEQAERKS